MPLVSVRDSEVLRGLLDSYCQQSSRTAVFGVRD